MAVMCVVAMVIVVGIVFVPVLNLVVEVLVIMCADSGSGDDNNCPFDGGCRVIVIVAIVAVMTVMVQ